MAWSPPETFDQYRMVRPLGRGAMGAVYLATDTVLERKIAIKFIGPDVADARDIAERALSEARALARLQHPNVVTVHGTGVVDERPYIASEYIDGRVLTEVPLPLAWDEALQILLGIARGLAAAHAAGVLHGDIKPANVMVDRWGTPKLVDFGLAHPWGHAGPSASRSTQSTVMARPGTSSAGSTIETLAEPASASTNEAFSSAPQLSSAELQKLMEATQSRRATPSEKRVKIVGTPRYLAPELWAGEPASPRSDIYAFGKLAYELLHGELPGVGMTLLDLAVHVQDTDLAPLHAVRPTIPEALSEIVDRCVRRNPDARWQDVQALVASLDSFRDGHALLRLWPAQRLESPDVSRVRGSFRRVLSQQTFASVFYARIFSKAPHLRPLFPENLEGQIRKLTDALRLAVDQLDRPERLDPVLEELGSRHVAYGVRDEHLDLFGDTLLETLAAFERDAWEPELERAWRRAYLTMMAAMLRGLERGRSAYRSTPPTPN